MKMAADRFTIFTSWKPRQEAAEKIYARMEMSVQDLGELNPIFHGWNVIDFADAIRNMAGGQTKRARIELERSRRDGEPKAPAGFMIFAGRDINSRQNDLHLLAANAGGKGPPGMCGVMLHTEEREAPDPRVVSYPSFKSIILALAPIWEATFAQAYSHALSASERSAEILRSSWITYLAPALAKEARLPSDIVIERMPDGGLLVAATKETFDFENPAHVKAAQRIDAALAPVNNAIRTL